MAYRPCGLAPASPSGSSHRVSPICVLELAPTSSQSQLVNIQEFVGSWKLTVVSIYLHERNQQMLKIHPPCLPLRAGCSTLLPAHTDCILAWDTLLSSLLSECYSLKPQSNCYLLWEAFLGVRRG